MSQTKKILIDFEKSKDPYSGLGQFCLFLKKYFDLSTLNLHYFIPPKKNLYRIMNFLLPSSDVFHAIHQDCPYIPFFKTTKYILTIHDLNAIYETDSEIAKSRFLKRLEKKIQRADAITFISEFTKSEVEKNFNLNSKKTYVIYNGISLPEKSQRPNIEIKTEFLFTIGTVLPKKNFHVLIDMMKLLPDLNLYIAGTTFHSYAKEMIDRVQKENLADRIFFMGTIANEEKKWMYEHSKGFVFPSLLEGFGLPVAEAMSLGIPLFLSDKTSLPEIGGSEAFYFKNFNAQDMASTIQEGLRNFDHERKLNLIKRSELFSWQKAAQKYLEIYQEI